MTRIALLAATAAVAFAGAAHAAPAISLDRVATPVQGPPLSLKPRPDLRAAASPMNGIAKTSVEHRFGNDEEMAALAGFICGRDSAADYHGAAGAYGDDPHGRFVGAKLSRSF